MAAVNGRVDAASAENPSPPQDEVFINGETDAAKSEALLHPEYNMPEHVIPRRSSLIKGDNRKKERKKTVSFSSMPNEKTVVNGKFKMVL